MKVVVFSDAHGSKILIERLISFNPDADFVISLGDSELSIDFLMDLDIIAIKGNYPRDGGFVFESTLEVGNKSIFMTHGHKFGVHKSLKKLLFHAMKIDSNIVLYGHTHIARVDKVDDIMLFNPGSLKSPRNKQVSSYLILDITDDEIKYTFKEAETNMTIENI